MKKGILIAVIIILAGVAVYLVLPARNPGEDTGPNSGLVPNIIVSMPSESEVDFPFTIRGEARVFESTVNIRLQEVGGEILFEGISTAQSPDVGEFGFFEKEINYLFKNPQTQDLVLDVYWISPKDGSETDLVSIPLKINLPKLMTLDAFFNNNELNPSLSCEKVFAVQRFLPETKSVARKSLELLFEGPSFEESVEGFFTNINFGVEIQELAINNGVAEADFNEILESNVGGSCSVSAIRAQITQTLKQFPTVQDATISINGETENILQP